MKDYSGCRFGNLIVKSFSHRKNNSYYWNCLCDCGNEKIIRITNLTTGLTQSCGCLKFKDLIDKKFGKLKVIKLISRKNGAKWLCKCDCGNEKIVSQSNLTSGNVKSCGCLFKEFPRTSFIKHNLYYTRLYRILKSMKDRCYLKTHSHYKDYGGRGITICDEWLKDNGIINFYNWAMENGYRDDLTIDRINVNGNYEPSNCRWVDRITQQNNTRHNKYYEYKGERLTLTQFAKKYNINIGTLNHRMKKYKNIKLCLETPINKSKSRMKKERN